MRYSENVLSVFVTPNHQDYIRFLWWPNGNIDKSLCDYRIKVHLFGAASSPAFANYGLKRTAEEGAKEFGNSAANLSKVCFYMDDGVMSVFLLSRGSY